MRTPNGLGLQEASRIAGVSPATLKDIKWRRKRNFPTRKFLGRLYFLRGEILAWRRGEAVMSGGFDDAR